MYLFQIIANFTNFQGSWRRYFEENEAEQEAMENEEVNYRAAKKEALQQGVFNLIKGSNYLSSMI